MILKYDRFIIKTQGHTTPTRTTAGGRSGRSPWNTAASTTMPTAIIPAGFIISVDRYGKQATIGNFDGINKEYTLLDGNGRLFPGTYKAEKWWNPQPPAPRGSVAVSQSQLPTQGTKSAPASRDRAVVPQRQLPAHRISMKPAKRIKAVPLPIGTIIKLNKKGTTTAQIGNYDVVSKRYTLHGRSSNALFFDEQPLPGSYEKSAYWDPVLPLEL